MIRRWAPAAIPYLAVLVGLHAFDNAGLAMGLYLAVALLVLLAEPPRAARLRNLVRGWDTPTAVLLGLVAAAAGPLLVALLPRFGVTIDHLASGLAASGVQEGTWFPILAVYILGTPWIEELFWRDRLGSRSPVPDLSDLLYAGYHLLVLARFLPLFAVGIALPVLVLIGWTWRRVRNRRGGLAVPALTHLVADASIILAVHAAVH